MTTPSSRSPQSSPLPATALRVLAPAAPLKNSRFRLLLAFALAGSLVRA